MVRSLSASQMMMSLSARWMVMSVSASQIVMSVRKPDDDDDCACRPNSDVPVDHSVSGDVSASHFDVNRQEKQSR